MEGVRFWEAPISQTGDLSFRDHMQNTVGCRGINPNETKEFEFNR